eukprot:scaffold94905_cov36-Cyclotella_meneghiniana.AAC.4
MHLPLSSAELMDCQLEQHLVRRMEILRGARKEIHWVQKRIRWDLSMATLRDCPMGSQMAETKVYLRDCWTVQHWGARMALRLEWLTESLMD